MPVLCQITDDELSEALDIHMWKIQWLVKIKCLQYFFMIDANCLISNIYDLSEILQTPNKKHAKPLLDFSRTYIHSFPSPTWS